MKLLVDSTEFWDSLKKDLSTAKNRIFIQAMSFEGDTVGQDLARSVIKSKAHDKRILIDSYSKFVINDRFVYNPISLFDRSFQSEVSVTRLLIKNLLRNKVGVKFTNPIGNFFGKYPFRNHKKLIVIDYKIAYLGGFNFCEHNFEWHDLMIRFDDIEAATFLASDFENTWNGKNNSMTKSMGAQRFFLFDGARSASLHQEIFDLFAQAEQSIWALSSYITHHYLDSLISAAKRGVDVNLISPEGNNKPLLKNYVLNKLVGTPVKFHLYQGRMSHLKAILIDDKSLIMGSSNFDFVSYFFEQEVVAILNNKSLIADFKERILTPDLANSIQADLKSPSFIGILSQFLLKIAYAACKFTGKRNPEN